MKKVQRGFSMIELVMVIAITGVLAAVAVPLFVDIRTDARTAALEGTAGALSSAAASNYAARGMDITKGFAVLNCTSTSAGLQGGLDALVYTITPLTVGANATASCTLNTVTTPVLTANFAVTGVL